MLMTRESSKQILEVTVLEGKKPHYPHDRMDYRQGHTESSKYHVSHKYRLSKQSHSNSQPSGNQNHG